MNIKLFLLTSFLYVMTLSQIEINLYKSALAYENLKEKDAMIDDIDKTHFLANLNMGTPSKPYPLQVEMDTEEIYIVNKKKRK